MSKFVFSSQHIPDDTSSYTFHLMPENEAERLGILDDAVEQFRKDHSTFLETYKKVEYVLMPAKLTVKVWR